MIILVWNALPRFISLDLSSVQGSDSDQDDQPEYFDDVDKYDTRDSFIDDRELVIIIL